jgi:hypothetical protein
MADENQPKVPLASLLHVARQQTQAPLAFSPYLIDRRVYKNATLNLDGYTFSNCVFLNCKLVTSKGNFRFRDCHAQGGEIHFNGNALNVVKLSSILIANWDHLPEGLRARFEPDGGITIA